jgi:hypothetical protein
VDRTDSLTGSPKQHAHTRRLDTIRLLLLLLTTEQRQLLQLVMHMLHKCSEHKNTNKMTASNLAVIFVPVLLCNHRVWVGGGDTQLNLGAHANRGVAAVAHGAHNDRQPRHTVHTAARFSCRRSTILATAARQTHSSSTNDQFKFAYSPIVIV